MSYFSESKRKKGKKGKNNGGSAKSVEKRGRTYPVCLRTHNKIMDQVRRIDTWKTVDTRGCEQRGHEGITSALVNGMTGNETKHRDKGKITQGGGNSKGKQRKPIAALKEYKERGNNELTDGGRTQKQRAKVKDAQPVQHRQTTMTHWRTKDNSIGNHTNNDGSTVHNDDFSNIPRVQQKELNTIKR